jgi:diguanylate cyclase (GGDEF)-like protein/PAS domain S-box-containing protein
VIEPVAGYGDVLDERKAELLRVLPALAGEDVLVAADEDRRIVWVSDSIETVLGWSPEEFRLVCTHLVHPGDQPLAEANSALVRIESGWHPAGEGRHLAKDGSWRWLRVSASNLLTTHGVVVTRFRDITVEKELERGLAMAARDDLTGLATRAVVRRHLDESLADPTVRVAVLFCDLDGFKTVNDDLGHGAGDEVLELVGRRLEAAVRDGDLVGRWGGDEFVAVVQALTDDEASTVAARLRAAVAQPFRLQGTQVRLGLSVGIACGTMGSDADTLVADADDAMYAAKRDGSGVAFAPLRLT